jgi:ATP-binding cassette subfamily C protein
MNYHWVMQHSGEDCAAASLAIVTKHYGRPIRINHIRDLVGTRQGGTTMLGLKRGAESLGFKTQAIKASPNILNELDQITLPAILYWKGYHFVVFYGVKRRKFVISDPAQGIRYIDRDELLSHWQGYAMLLLEPDPERFDSLCRDPSPPLNPFASLVERLWQGRSQLQPLIPLNLGVGLLALATPLLLQYLTDQILAQNKTEHLTIVALGVIFLTLLNTTLAWIQSNLIASFAEKLQQSLKLDFGRQILHLPLTYHEGRSSGTAIRRLADIQQINTLITQLVIELPIKAFIGLTAALVIVLYNWSLGSLILAIGILVVMASLALQPSIQRSTQRAFSVAGENSGVLAEAFNGALTLKTISAASQLWPEFQQRVERESTHNLKAARTRIISTTLTDTLTGIGTVILLWWGSALVFQGQLTIGKLIAIYGLREGFFLFIHTLVQVMAEWTEIKAITRLLAELFEYTPEDQGDRVKAWVALSPSEDIHLTQLNFHYPGRTSGFTDLSLTLPGGKPIALIGASGCGKSTLAKLLTGLYPLASGEIRIGSHPIHTLPLDCLRKQIILVPQDAFFLHRSILDNFRLAVPDATFEQIKTACQIAGADEFIHDFPQRYDTILGVVGANLSGGQRQRVAIARAILQNPPILILDESTANLDPETEAEILSRLLTHRRGKTTILISHHPQVISVVDWVIRLEAGKVQFSGSVHHYQNSFFANVSLGS